MSETYLFYDIETTGLNKCFDQVLQFAAIRTTLDFKELERYEIFVKLKPTVIPSPTGLITHRISLEKMQTGETELNAMQSIHRLFNTPGTISLGYNSLSFDDEFLRFSFYRNLLPPYTHQFANGCRRMDLFPITIMYALFKPEVLHWKKRQDHANSLKLEDINHANNLAPGNAHNAMVDVEATLALAKVLAQQQEMWTYLTGQFDKATDLERLAKLPYSLKLKDTEHQEALMISSKFGYGQQFIAPVAYLGQHNHYRNKTLWLRLDQTSLTQTTEKTIATHTYVIDKKYAENQFALPALPRYLNKISQSRKEITDQNRQWLKDNPRLFNKIMNTHRDYTYPSTPNQEICAALYDLGFPSSVEEKRYAQFHQAPPEDKEALALTFADPIRKELALRLLAQYYPQHLSAENHKFYQDYQAHCRSEHNPPVDFKNMPQLTKTQALKEIKTLHAEKKSLDSEQQHLLLALEQYLLAAY